MAFNHVDMFHNCLVFPREDLQYPPLFSFVISSNNQDSIIFFLPLQR